MKDVKMTLNIGEDSQTTIGKYGYGYGYGNGDGVGY